MDFIDLMTKLAGVASVIGMLMIAFRNAPHDTRATEASAKKVEAETESIRLDNYEKVTKRLDEYGATNARLRLDLDTQSEEIKQLRIFSNHQEERIQSLKVEAAISAALATDYKAKWELTSVGLDECRASCQKQAAQIRQISTILRSNGLMTPELEQSIQQSLTPNAPAAAPESNTPLASKDEGKA